MPSPRSRGRRSAGDDRRGVADHRPYFPAALTLREYKTLDQQVAELNLRSPDQTKAYIASAGETITRIAERASGDPRDWRAIADANRIEDPLALVPGMRLAVPATT